jgi:hypothetical protein
MAIENQELTFDRLNQVTGGTIGVHPPPRRPYHPWSLTPTQPLPGSDNSALLAFLTLK